jgi:hypothetical protein
MFFKSLLLSCFFFLHSGILLAYNHPEQGVKGFYERKFESPEPFEKIYVDHHSIVYKPEGVFLKHPFGNLEKVRCISQDYKGTYVLRIHTQCQKCGRVYTGRESPEGWNCLD